MSRSTLTRTVPTRRTRRLAALTATLAVGLAGALSGPASAGAEPAPAARVPLSPATAPRGPAPRVPWFDTRHQVVHEGDRTTTVREPFEARVLKIRTAEGGYLARVAPLNRGSRLELIGFDGSRRTVVRTPKLAAAQIVDWEVSDDGTHVAYSYSWDEGYGVAVVRIADGVELARLQGDVASVLSVVDGEVWLTLDAEGGDHEQRLTRWRWSDGRLTTLAPRLDGVVGVDVAAGYAWRDAYSERHGKGIKVIPLQPAVSGRGWTSEGVRLLGFSPGARRVATYQQLDRRADRYPHPGRIVLRDARDGRVLRTFAGLPGEEPAIWPAVWETPSKLLAPVHASTLRQTVLRLSVGGRVERATVLAEGPRSGPPVTLMPSRR